MQVVFPGRVFGFDAVSMDPAAPNLTQQEIDSCACRHIIGDPGLPPVARCWLLTSDATFARIPEWQRVEAVGLIRSGFAVMVLAHAEDAADNVVAGLLTALGGTGAVGSA